MDITTLFKKAVRELHSQSVHFAIGGGFAASLYRKEPRVTNDIDILILADDSLSRAQAIIEAVGLKAAVARKADLEGGPLFAIKKKSTEPQMVIGRAPGSPHSPGLDFLLPSLPWQSRALERAQDNQHDFGFGPVPCLTAEDVIIGKLYALKNRSDRFKDLDDLQSIFQVKRPLDISYLSGAMREHSLIILEALETKAPPALAKISRAMRRELKPRKKEFPTR